jgi:hypothetical protein
MGESGLKRLEHGNATITGVQHTPAGWVIVAGTQFNAVKFNEGFRDTTALRTLNTTTGEMGGPVLKMTGPLSFLFGKLGWAREEFMASRPYFSVSTTGNMYATPGNQYAIRILTAGDSAAHEVRGDVERIPVTDADFQRDLEKERSKYGKRPPLGGDEDGFFELLYDLAPKAGHAPFRPVLGRIRANSDGRFIVERLDLDPDPHASGDPATWDVIGVDGRIEGRFVAPPRVAPLLFRRENVFATATDLDGVQSVVRYRLVKGG